MTRLNALTGLRFVAAAMILIHHASVFGIQLPALALDHGVSFFFVLSGFVLAYVHPSIGSAYELRAFLWNRVVRVWPAHLVMLFVAIILLNLPITWAFPLNFFLLQAWVPVWDSYFSYNAVSWSISTELGFYLAFPFFIHRWGKTFWWKLPLATGIVAATIHLSNIYGLTGHRPGTEVTYHGLVYISPLGRILEFVVGIAGCSVYRWLKPRIAFGSTVGTGFEIAAVSAFYYTMSGYIVGIFDAGASGPMRAWLAHSSSLPSCFLVITVFALGRGYISRLLSCGVAVLLGEISYPLYLTHQVVYNVYLKNFPRGPNADYVGLFICLIASLGSAYLIWRYVETPARKFFRIKTKRLAIVHTAYSQPTTTTGEASPDGHSGGMPPRGQSPIAARR